MIELILSREEYEQLLEILQAYDLELYQMVIERASISDEEVIIFGDEEFFEEFRNQLGILIVENTEDDMPNTIAEFLLYIINKLTE